MEEAFTGYLDGRDQGSIKQKKKRAKMDLLGKKKKSKKMSRRLKEKRRVLSLNKKKEK